MFSLIPLTCIQIGLILPAKVWTSTTIIKYEYKTSVERAYVQIWGKLPHIYIRKAVKIDIVKEQFCNIHYCDILVQTCY